MATREFIGLEGEQLKMAGSDRPISETPADVDIGEARPISETPAVVDIGEAGKGKPIGQEGGRPKIAGSDADGPIPEIPMVDLGEADQEKLTKAIHLASREWGIFQVVNHGIPVDLIRRLQQAGREFFELPREEKEAYAKPPNYPGVEGYGTQVRSDLQGKKSWVDHLFHKIWPPTSVNYRFWPKNPAYYREVNEEYAGYIRQVADKLFRSLSLGLGVEENALKEALGGEELQYNLKINYYPQCPQPDLMTFGVVAHTDLSSLTILVPNEVPGLQVLKDGRWIDAEHIPNALIIHIGDQIEVILAPGPYSIFLIQIEL
ncbi:hypothetical protein SAY87_024540 [Trapa incisa]|uniref:Fe2OG dioxygenase domain-containing protein n=1 Tax=Trapa incisa TaxID=236973 RepID=A0AAN7GQF0_9MYRT|nr:hypothetical protein SAY87_024540 [Trapa incisa]